MPAGDLGGDAPRPGRRPARVRCRRRRADGARRRARAASAAAPGGPAAAVPPPAPGRRWGRDRRPGRRGGRRRRADGGRPGQHGGDVALGDVVEQRAAARGGRGCAGSVDRRSTGPGTARGRPRHRPPRSRPAAGASSGWRSGRMPAQPVEPRAPEQRQQHRLGLVVGGVAEQRVRREHGVAGRPGPGLEVAPGVDLDALGAERGAEAARRVGDQRRPRRSLPGRSPWSTWTAVTSRPASTGEHEQGERVGAARHRARDRRRRGPGTWHRCTAPEPGVRRRAPIGVTRRRRAARRSGAAGAGRGPSRRRACGRCAQAGVDVRPAHPELGGGVARPTARRPGRGSSSRCLSVSSAPTTGGRARRLAVGCAAAGARAATAGAGVRRTSLGRRPFSMRASSDEGAGLGLAALVALGADRRGPRGRRRGAGRRRHRLDQVPDRALDAAPEAVVVGAEGGHHQHPHRGDLVVEVALSCCEHGPAVDLGHHHVEQDDVGHLDLRRRPAPRRRWPRSSPGGRRARG